MQKDQRKRTVFTFAMDWALGNPEKQNQKASRSLHNLYKQMRFFIKSWNFPKRRAKRPLQMPQHLQTQRKNFRKTKNEKANTGFPMFFLFSRKTKKNTQKHPRKVFSKRAPKNPVLSPQPWKMKLFVSASKTKGDWASSGETFTAAEVIVQKRSFGYGSKRCQPQRGPQVLVYFSFYQGFFRYPVFLTHSHLESGDDYKPWSKNQSKRKSQSTSCASFCDTRGCLSTQQKPTVGLGCRQILGTSLRERELSHETLGKLLCVWVIFCSCFLVQQMLGSWSCSLCWMWFVWAVLDLSGGVLQVLAHKQNDPGTKLSSNYTTTWFDLWGSVFHCFCCQVSILPATSSTQTPTYSPPTPKNEKTKAQKKMVLPFSTQEKKL